MSLDVACDLEELFGAPAAEAVPTQHEARDDPADDRRRRGAQPARVRDAVHAPVPVRVCV